MQVDGKGDDKASYNAQDVRAYLETQVADISKGEEEPVDDETATFKKEEGMYKSAVESWNKLADECGKATDSVSDFAINEQNGELAVTEVIQFEDRNVNITSTFEESDNGYIMTSLSFDPIYSIGEKMEQAAAEIGNASYGGNDDADNSGVLKYIRLEYTGYAFDEEHEANGVSFYGVGNGTTVEHLQAYNGIRRRNLNSSEDLSM